MLKSTPPVTLNSRLPRSDQDSDLSRGDELASWGNLRRWIVEHTCRQLDVARAVIELAYCIGQAGLTHAAGKRRLISSQWLARGQPILRQKVPGCDGFPGVVAVDVPAEDSPWQSLAWGWLLSVHVRTREYLVHAYALAGRHRA